MKTENYLYEILDELNILANQIDLADMDSLINLINQAKHIFLSGAGRSKLVAQSFANRLLHLGFSVSVVGEISSPRSQKGDLLIICSGSGETNSLVSLAKEAVDKEIKIALVTESSQSTIGDLSDTRIRIGNKSTTYSHFEQPMGTTFEQFAFLYFDNIVLNLCKLNNESFASMKSRHADLE